MTTANRSELAILKQLWVKSPRSAREVQDAISSETGWSYSTTRTLLTRMEEKGLITSSAGGDDGRRRYRPTALGERALLAARAFAGELRLEAKA